MGASPLFAMVIALLMLGIVSITKDFKNTQPAAQFAAQAPRNADATAFLGYRAAVDAYMAKHPTFTGSIPFTELSALGAPTRMLELANNQIVETGTAGRIVMVYASLLPGVIENAAAQTQNDASLGIAHTANSWTSIAPGSQTYPLPTETIPKGAIVSVVQLGI